MRRPALFLAAVAFIAQARAGGLYDHLFEPGALRLDEVIGMEVLGPDGAPVGRIEDVLFDRATGTVQSIALDRKGLTYPISALVATDKPGQVIVEALLDPSSAGGTALLPSRSRALSSARGETRVIDLREGRVRPRQ